MSSGTRIEDGTCEERMPVRPQQLLGLRCARLFGEQHHDVQVRSGLLLGQKHWHGHESRMQYETTQMTLRVVC
jgi:hypothetical protein